MALIPLVCTLPASSTEGLIHATHVYSCPTVLRNGSKGASLGGLNTRKAPFYAFRDVDGAMRSLWRVVFNGNALRLTPSGNRRELHRQALRQRHRFFDFSDQQLEAFCDYAQQSYALGRLGTEDYTQEQHYQFLELNPGRQPDARRLPRMAANTAGLTYVDFGQFLAGGPLRSAG